MFINAVDVGRWLSLLQGVRQITQYFVGENVGRFEETSSTFRVQDE
jgi:hypothetical protein